MMHQFSEPPLSENFFLNGKPGLVDWNNSGSHKDMDFYSFLNSSTSLWPYFEKCARIGQETACQEAPLTFGYLWEEGKLAENHMLRATGGVNTHKGAIFSMGIAAEDFPRAAL